MDQESEQLKTEIMRRIERVYKWRTYVRPFVIECTMLAGIVGGATFFVSIRNVVTNAYATRSVGSIFNYGWTAFTHTELSVQVMTVAGLVLVSLIARDTASGIARTATRIRSAFA